MQMRPTMRRDSPIESGYVKNRPGGGHRHASLPTSAAPHSHLSRGYLPWRQRPVNNRTHCLETDSFVVFTFEVVGVELMMYAKCVDHPRDKYVRAAHFCLSCGEPLNEGHRPMTAPTTEQCVGA